MKSDKLIENPTISGKCVFVLLILIFCLTMTTFVLIELANPTNKTTETLSEFSQLNSTKFFVVNVKERRNFSMERVSRQVLNTKGNPQGYYEEQQPVVVHAESSLPLMDMRKTKNMTEQGIASDQEEDEVPYYAYDNEEDYFNPGKSSSFEQYDKNSEDEEYYEGRSTLGKQYDSRQWNYNPWVYWNNEDRTQNGKKATGQVSNPYPSSQNNNEDIVEYDYPMGFVHRKLPHMQQHSYNTDIDTQQKSNIYARKPDLQQQQNVKQKTQQRPTTAPVQTNESTLLSVVRGLKTMWDIYQAFSIAWNTIAEHSQRQSDALKDKLKQEQRTRIRINSKKPPKFTNSTITTEDIKVNSDKLSTNARIRSTKSPKPKTTTTKLPQVTTLNTPKSTTAKVEPRQGSKGDQVRKKERRAAVADDAKEVTSVGEGRYIKGDPLKGYYDFVITEGSYKFWAVFQTGTAILIIYSVFAAIYYSKVNPLVSDYDYTDYLGGARSLSGGDLDFVDDDDNTKSSTAWYNGLLPKAGHSLKFILDAIDKFPVDHETNFENEENTNIGKTTPPLM